VCFILCVAGELTAQPSPFVRPDPAAGRVQITLVLNSRGGRTAFFRRSQGEHSNVVLVDSATATAQQLSNAVFGLLVAEAQDPDGHGRSENMAHETRLNVQRPAYSWAVDALALLTAERPQPVRGMGMRRAIRIWLPPLTRRIGPAKTGEP
jgi:hypothetical protein